MFFVGLHELKRVEPAKPIILQYSPSKKSVEARIIFQLLQAPALQLTTLSHED